MPGSKLLSFILGLSLLLGSCTFDFSDNKEEEKAKEDTKDTLIRIQKDGEEIEVDVDELERNINESVNKMVSDLTSQLEGIGNNSGNGEEEELMDHRDLKSLLPSYVGWLKQTAHSSEKSGIFGFRVATAKARFESKDKWIEMELVDLGGMPIARFGLSFLDQVEVDRESKDEFEKIYEKDGNKHHDQYHKTDKWGELKTVINDRYVLNVKGRNVKLSELENARDKVKINKLE